MSARTASETAQAELLKALAHPVRLRLMEELRQEAECVCHLTTLTGKSQSYISKQLAVLKLVGLVKNRRAGQWVFYRIADPRIANLLNTLREISGAPSHAEESRQPVPGCPCPACESALER